MNFICFLDLSMLSTVVVVGAGVAAEGWVLGDGSGRGCTLRTTSTTCNKMLRNKLGKRPGEISQINMFNSNL